LPDSANPRIENWIPVIAKTVGNPDEQTFFVGHSMGNQAIARYLEGLSSDKKVGGVIFVAGFFKRLTGLTDEEKETGAHWLQTPLDLRKVKSHFDKSVAIFSDDDEFVPPDNQEEFKTFFQSEVIIEKSKGHLNGEAGVFELPIVLNKLLEIAG
jgi:predicted alpha/beta hydrolase family esterase